MAMERRTALKRLGSAGVVAWVAPSIVSVESAAAASAPCTLCGTNLVMNASAEVYEPDDPANASFDPNIMVGTAPGAVPVQWATSNGFRVITYGSAQYPATAPSGGGSVMFAGSNAAGSASPGTAVQTVPVGECADQIDGGGLAYTLSGTLGGTSGEADTMTFSAAFLDGALATISSATLGPVAATTFTSSSTSGTVPTGTRFVRFELTATKVGSHTRNTAAADLLGFVLC